MKKKGALFAILSLALATSVASAASSNQEKTSVPVSSPVVSQSSNNSINSTDGLFSPFIVDKSFDMLANGAATVQNPFTINPGYGHIKFLIKNYSSASVNVTLTHTDSGLVYFSKTIPASSSLEWYNFKDGYPQGMRSGNYILQWSGGGTNVNGEVFGKLASSTTDF
ncbi:hypothetical protein AWM70_13855 [Paenibacillus yonginensis]|uniref:FlgD Ig-like domain-containing protein n=1 Tax=Paenibacillus yonginensis TaxID=1462996 RepID=A0A1B1N2A8_9BACL|nr:hypothetical protein [Paenibacillus yonginensis]ANS75548.1 hypothetical protein AWM70_13855 [Paenibacillus yonginensis]